MSSPPAMPPALTVGSVTVNPPLILGPMAGVTDRPFRELCRAMGAGLVTAEMVSAKGLFYQNEHTKDMLSTGPREHPVALQLFGHEPEVLREVVQYPVLAAFDMLDFNMGCPVPKVVKNGEGSALMQNPRLAAAIVRAMVSATDKPVTVKIRKGFSGVNAVEVAKRLADAGAAAVTVHGRTREEYYTGKADWDIIRRVKEAVAVPVIGNGDVTSPETASALLRETGCDGVMISRAARGNPWIFRQVAAYWQNGERLPAPDLAERKSVIWHHACRVAAVKGEAVALRQMRGHLLAYTQGLSHAAEMRRRLSGVCTLKELRDILSSWAAPQRKEEAQDIQGER